MARCFYAARQLEEGDKIVNSLLRRADEWLLWIATIRPARRAGSLYSQYSWLQTMQQALALAARYDRTVIYQKYSKQYELYIQQYPQD